MSIIIRVRQNARFSFLLNFILQFEKMKSNKSSSYLYKLIYPP